MKTRVAHILVAATALCALRGPVAVAGAADRYRVEGNAMLREKRILSVLRTLTGSDADKARAVQEVYYREGYLDARIRVHRTADDSVLVVTIAEGKGASVGSARVIGAQVIPADEIRTVLGLNAGSAFRPRALADRIRFLLRRYDNDGYPFAQVWIDSVGHDQPGNAVHMRLSVVEGTQRTITGVSVEGLSKTRPDLVLRIAGIEPGTPYRAGVLEAAYLRLLSSGLFDRVDRPGVRVSADGQGVDAVLPVRESARSNSFMGALGYVAAEDGGEERTISGLVHLNLANVGGSLKDFEAYWTNDGRDRSETRIAYRDRFFFGRLLTFGLSLEQVGQDTLFTWQSLGMEAEKPVGRAGDVLVSLGVGLSADRNVFSVGNLLRSWRYRGAMTASLLRGNRVRPGFVELTTRLTVARKNNTLRADSTDGVAQFIVEVEGDASVSFSRLVHGRVAPVYRGLESSEVLVPLSEQFYIGGARTLRGYRESQFHGRRVATMATELLIGPDRLENAYLFVDAGYVLQEVLRPDGSIDAGSAWPVGFGFGFRTGSPLGTIDLSFGMGDEVSLQQTKVHVLLQQRF